ncbi:MAG: Ig-like domain-containing protein [Acidobacteriaceae bacterium]|nr:Ig-like domain-containing protein [Acidobacteriaceae bacterium]
MTIIRSITRVFAGLAVLGFIAGCGGSTPAPPSLSVAVTPATATLVAGATQTFTATVSNDSASAGVTWTASTGVITSAGVYTAPTPVGAATATITATSKTDATKTGTAVVTLTPISVTIPTTPTAIAGLGAEAITATVAGDATLNQGVTWTITSGGGTLTAVTTSSVTYNAPLPVTTATAVITAASKTDTSKTATITIPLTPISVGAISPATVSLGVGSSQAFTGAAVANDASGSGVTWSISPATGAGTIVSTTGVYTAPTTVINTATTVTVTATSVKDPTKTATAAITLQPIAIAAISPATVTVSGGGGQNFSGAALTYDGSNSGVTWSISPSSGAGAIVSTTGVYTAPTVIGSITSATITATSVKDTSKTATATVTLAPISVSFTTTTSGVVLDSGQTLTLAAALMNDSGASGATFSASGAGTVSPSSATGNAPATTLTATGTTASTVTVTATSIKDTTRTASTSAITVNPALAITTAAGALTAATTNTPYAGATIATSGGSGTKTFTTTPVTGALPSGLSLSSSGTISGTITAAAGTYTFTVRVTDAATTPVSVTSGTYTITVTAAPLVWTNPASATTLPAMTVGTAMTPYTLATTGGTGSVTYSVVGTLPAGLQLIGNVLSGTPTAPTVVAGSVVQFKATDSASTPVVVNSGNVTLVVNPVTLAITTTSLPAGGVGSSYTATMTSTGGTGTINWTMSPTPVVGLTMSTAGVLSGTPTGAYSSAVTITATDSATNQQQTKSITPTLTINPLINTTTVLSPQTSTIVAGTSITLTATVAPSSGTTTPTGTVSFYVSSTLLGTSTLNGSGVATLATTALPVGSDSVKAVYNGSTTNATSTSSTSNITVNLATTTTTMVAAPTTATVGSTVTLTATVTNSVSTAITGTISFYYGGSTFLGNGTVASGIATLAVTTLPLGTNGVDAVYNGDAINATSTSSTSNVTIITAYSISGQINLNNYCGGSSPTLPNITVTLTQGSTTVQTQTATNGAYTFTNIAPGTYTITPSPSISGASAVFYPVSSGVTLGSSNSTNNNFGVALGYTVGGTLTYTGSKTGRVYLSLSNNNCGGNYYPGTSLASVSSSGTSYSIRGVAPGSYSVTTWIDTLGRGQSNTADPSGTGSVTVGTAAVTNANFTITDPGTTTLTTAPTLQSVNPIPSSAGGTGVGLLLAYSGLSNSNNVETAVSYTVQWSTSSTFATGTITDSQTFLANGVNGADIWFLNSASHPSLTNTSSYYFRVYGTSAGGTSPYGTYNGSGSSAALVSLAPPTGGTTQTGSVTLGSTSTGPLYVGFYNTSTGVFYGEWIPSPAATQAFSVNVPAGTTYYFVGAMDQNNNGIIDAGDVTNTNNLKTLTTVPLAGASLVLPTSAAYTLATTNYFSSTSSSGSSANYSVNAGLSALIKQPVAVVLTTSSNADGANAVVPQDLGICNSCGGSGFESFFNTNNIAPTIGDTYGFSVTYSDASTGTVNATTTGLLGPSALATGLTPSLNGTNTQPTFAWTYPANASSYTFYFSLCCSTNGTIWQIPGNNSHSNGGFTSTQIPGASLTWGIDPTNSSNNLSGGTALTHGTTYNWQIQTNDTAGDSATRQVSYTP